MLTWINGHLVDEATATVSAFDRGLTVGDGVFETLKVVSGVPFALGRHLGRLRRSAAGLGLPAPIDDDVRTACAQVVEQADEELQYRLRITYTAGPASLGPARAPRPAQPDSDSIGPTLMVTLTQIQPPPATSSAALVPWARNERSPVAGIKTTSYVENVMMLDHARSLGASEAIMANTRGRLCEGAGSNVFVVVRGQALTPPLAAGCLAGVTRDLVLEWCDVRETDLDVAVLADADEIFLTSSTRDVQALEIVLSGGQRRDLPASGPVTERIAATFAERSRRESEP